MRRVPLRWQLPTGFLFLAGLAFQVAQGWSSIPGDVLWAMAGLGGVALILLTPAATALERLSVICSAVAVVAFAGLMVDWIVVDAGAAVRPSWWFVGALCFVLLLSAALAIFARRR